MSIQIVGELFVKLTSALGAEVIRRCYQRIRLWHCGELPQHSLTLVRGISTLAFATAMPLAVEITIVPLKRNHCGGG
jgi:hypothetical protein